MKKFNRIENFKSNIRFAVSIFASREFAFIYCLLGTIGQVAHTYFLSSSISSYEGFFRAFQATIISTFISSSLLYFVAISDKEDVEYKKNLITINILMIIEILINFYYYAKHLLIDCAEMRVFDFIFSIMISCLLPVIIKLFASHIRAKEWLQLLKESKTEETDNNTFTESEIKSSILEDKIDETLSKVTEINEKLHSDVSNFASKIDETNEKIGEIESKIDENDLRIKSLNELFEQRINNLVEENSNNESIDVVAIVKDEMDKWTKSIDSNVAEIFSKNQEKFINQAQNKLKLLYSEISEKMKNQQ